MKLSSLADRIALRRLGAFVQRPGAAASVAGNAAWLILDKLMRMALALIVGAWVARHLGPSQFGQLAYAVTFITLCQGIANLGADGIIVRDLARDPAAAPLLLGTVLRLRLAVSTLCWATATVVVYLLRPQDPQAALLTAIVGAGLVFQSADTVDLWFQSQGRNARTVQAKLASYVIANGLRIVLLLADAPLWTFALAAAVDAATLAGALATVYRRHPTVARWHGQWSCARRLLSESSPYMVGGLAALLYMRIDQLMIREMIGEEALGFYSAAVPLSQVWAVIPVTLATALAPYMSRMKARSEADYMEALFKVFRIFAALSVAATLLTVLFAGPLVRLLYGPAYAASGRVLAIHACANLFVYLGVAQGLWLVNEGKGRMTLYRTVLGALVSVAGNWVVIPRFGIVGAAAVNVLAQCVAAVGSNAFFAPRILRLQLLAFLPRARRATALRL